MHRCRDLTIYQKSKQIAVIVYKNTNDFPSYEKFGITNQIRRSAVSIPSNIAEGTSRHSNIEFNRFLEIALGSAYELETQLDIANEVGYIDQLKHKEMTNEISILIKMISNFQKRLS